MTELPASIKVGPFTYRIFRDVTRMAAIKSDCGEVYRVGQINYQTLEIDIDPVLAPERQVVALFHEVLHAAMHLGFEKDREEHTDEQIAANLDALLVMILRDNPDLVAAIMRGVP